MAESSHALHRRALEAKRERRFADAERDLLEAVGLLRQENAQVGLAQALRDLGEVERNLPDGDAARRHYEEAVAIFREMDDQLKLAHTVRHLGDVHHDAGRTALAEPCYREALHLYRRLSRAQPLDVANAIRSMAVLKDEASELEHARQLWEEARVLYAAVGAEAGVSESDRRLALLAQRRGPVE